LPSFQTGSNPLASASVASTSSVTTFCAGPLPSRSASAAIAADEVALVPGDPAVHAGLPAV
jgi:hypothetical protein